MSDISSNSNSKRFKFLLVLLFAYVVLFEFILPVNRVLPRPSLLLDSMIAVWRDYNLLYEISISTLIIYGAMIAAYLLIHLLRQPLLKTISLISGGLNLLRVFRFFPAFFYAVIFAYWFPDSLVAEFGFVLVAFVFYMLAEIRLSLPNVNNNYILVAGNLGVPENRVYSEVIWKELQPGVFSALGRMHYFAWILVLIFEYIGNYAGLGHVYNAALTYNDFAGLFSIAIYASLLILLGDFLVKYAKKRLIYWDR